MPEKKEKRVALVIGNAAYENAAPLNNPINDAIKISAALKELGFEVVEGKNLGNSGMGDSVCAFEEKLEGADVALLYYSGHGLQFKDKNYLIPIEARVERETHLRFGAVDLDDLLSPMMRLAKTSLIFLDACRDNPFSDNLARSLGIRSIGHGLAEIHPKEDCFIAFATSPGSVAYDGIGGDTSPFTGALLKHIKEKEASLNDIMVDVTEEVYRITEGKQKPWTHSSLLRRFYFSADKNYDLEEDEMVADPTKVRLRDVFRFDRTSNPLSYIVRDVEIELLNTIRSKKYKIICVYGTSKSGKTSLLRSAIDVSERISISAQRDDSIGRIYEKMIEACKQESEFNHFDDCDSVVKELEALSSLNVIVIDNFHHLDDGVQRKLAIDVRIFEERGFQFIIIGTWTDSGYLQAFNFDLAGTIKEISVEPWEKKDLLGVMENGAEKLNIVFASNFKNSLAERSVGNVGLLQRLIEDCLEDARIDGYQNEKKYQVCDPRNLDRIAGKVESDLLHNVITTLRIISKIGDVYANERTRSYWILQAFLRSDIDTILKGMSIDKLQKKANDYASRESPNAGIIQRGTVTRLIKDRWFETQNEAINAQIVTYHNVTDSLVISDAWARFVIRSRRLEIAEQL